LTVSDQVSARACENLLGLAAALDSDAARSGVKVALRIGRREPMLGMPWENAPAP
jgi:hypothetical protein